MRPRAGVCRGDEDGGKTGGLDGGRAVASLAQEASTRGRSSSDEAGSTLQHMFYSKSPNTSSTVPASSAAHCTTVRSSSILSLARHRRSYSPSMQTTASATSGQSSLSCAFRQTFLSTDPSASR